MNNINFYRILKNWRFEMKSLTNFRKISVLIFSFFLLVSSLEAVGRKPKQYGPDKGKSKKTTTAIQKPKDSFDLGDLLQGLDEEQKEIVLQESIQWTINRCFKDKEHHSTKDILSFVGKDIGDNNLKEAIKYIFDNFSDDTKNKTTLFIMHTLISSLPLSLIYLTNLKKVVIYKNEQLSSIPSFISKWIDLEELSIWGNDIKYLPKEISELNKLKKLDIELQKHGQSVLLPMSLKQRVDSGQLYICGKYTFVPDDELPSEEELRFRFG
ncbi:MAG: hypothetical protein ABIA74_00850 [bacterium]